MGIMASPRWGSGGLCTSVAHTRVADPVYLQCEADHLGAGCLPLLFSPRASFIYQSAHPHGSRALSASARGFGLFFSFLRCWAFVFAILFSWRLTRASFTWA